MKISVKVNTGAKQEKVEAQPDGSLKVWVRAVPERGRANERVVELLSEYFGKARQDIRILRGHTASRKLIEVD